MMVAEMGIRDIESPINNDSVMSESSAMEYNRDSFQRADSRSDGSDSYSDISNGKRKDYFAQRKRREFIPDNKKDESYWDRRRRNNEAAKRSREKRRFNDMILETRVVELSKENHILKAQLAAIKEKYGISGEGIISVEQVMAAFPNNEQVLNQTKRVKLMSPSPGYPPSPTPSRPAATAHPMHIFPGPPPNLAESAFPLQESDHYPQAQYAYQLPSLLQPQLDVANNSVLNLSCDRSHSQPSPAPCPCPCDNSCESGEEGPQPLPLTTAPGPNNSLPHKLRHKSRIGDKDVASALLSLQGIKQEPGPLSSPPWDGEGSSDERDSGISMGGEWATHADREQEPESVPSEDTMKTELARLASEVANLKNFLSIKKPIAASQVGQ